MIIDFNKSYDSLHFKVAHVIHKSLILSTIEHDFSVRIIEAAGSLVIDDTLNVMRLH